MAGVTYIGEFWALEKTGLCDIRTHARTHARTEKSVGLKCSTIVEHNKFVFTLIFILNMLAADGLRSLTLMKLFP